MEIKKVVFFLILFLMCSSTVQAESKKVHLTCYLPTGNVTYSGCYPYEGIVAGRKEDLLKIVTLHGLNDEHIGAFEVRDTGGSKGIKNGHVIDVYRMNEDSMNEFVRTYGMEAYAEYFESWEDALNTACSECRAEIEKHIPSLEVPEKVTTPEKDIVPEELEFEICETIFNFRGRKEKKKMNDIESFIGLDFEGVKRSHHRDDSFDIGISLCSDGKFNIGFRNGTRDLIEGESLTFCVRDNTLIFKGAIAGKGYKFTQNNKCGNYYCKVTPNDAESFRKFVGDHTLKYEKLLGLYYVQVGD